MKWVALLVAAAAVAGLLFVGTSSQGFSSFLQPNNCDWSTLKLENQSFENTDSLKNFLEERDLQYSRLKQTFDIRQENNFVEYRAKSGCKITQSEVAG